MLGQSQAFSGFAVGDLDAARRFYGETLGLQVEETGQGDMRMLTLRLAGGTQVFVYPKEAHTPATFTILNFPVDDIEAAVDELQRRGVTLERYPGFDHDEKGIVRIGEGEGDDAPAAIAWFTDPAGNVLAILQEH
ncbi:VOC family protein [Streptomyces sp. NPDC001928]|uniref:VOC family protein n=1 Tax=Streptomyces sp. NPDC001928 TaxID=3154404 RepID=UPI0033295906